MDTFSGVGSRDRSKDLSQSTERGKKSGQTGHGHWGFAPVPRPVHHRLHEGPPADSPDRGENPVERPPATRTDSDDPVESSAPSLQGFHSCSTGSVPIARRLSPPLRGTADKDHKTAYSCRGHGSAQREQVTQAVAIAPTKHSLHMCRERWQAEQPPSSPSHATCTRTGKWNQRRTAHA